MGNVPPRVMGWLLGSQLVALFSKAEADVENYRQIDFLVLSLLADSLTHQEVTRPCCKLPLT